MTGRITTDELLEKTVGGASSGGSTARPPEENTPSAALRQRLADAARTDQIFAVINAAAALAEEAKRAKDGVRCNEALEVMARAERKGGELLAEMLARGEIGTRRGQLTYGALGFSKTTSQRDRWKQLAAIPEAEFEAKLAAKRRAAAAGTRLPPVEQTKMCRTPWVRDANGVLTREIYAVDAAAEVEAPTIEKRHDRRSKSHRATSIPKLMPESATGKPQLEKT